MTAWTPGQWVQASNGDERFWDGAGWAVGKAPPLPIQATGATAGTPGFFTPDGCETPTGAQLIGLPATPETPWTEGQYVVAAAGNELHWDGSAWALDAAPAPDSEAG